MLLFRRLLLFSFGAFLLFWLPHLEARQPEGSQIRLTAEAGFDGYYKSEFWVPVRITISNDGPAIEGQLQVDVQESGSSDSLRYSSHVTLPTQSSKRITLYVHLPTLTRELPVELSDGEGRIISSIKIEGLDLLAREELLYLVITDQPGALDFLEDVQADRPGAAVAYGRLSDLPAAPSAWNQFDVLVFHSADIGQLDADQHVALRSWIENGGLMVVTGGSDVQAAGEAIGDLLPVVIQGVTSAEDLSSLAGTMDLPFRDPGPYMVAESSLDSGELLLHEDGLPLLAAKSLGRGMVFFLALDPAAAPLEAWQGSELLWSMIAEHSPSLPLWGLGAQQSYQAVNAVSSLPNLALPSPLLLFTFLIGYVFVVGPLNYWFLRRKGKRELAWLTIPAVVLIFSISGYLIGIRIKGNEVIINQMSIVNGSIDSDSIRVQTLMGLYSPRRETYDMSVPEHTFLRPFDRSFGQLGGTRNVRQIEQTEITTADDIRVDVSEVVTFVADSYRPAPQIAAQATLIVEGNDLKIDVEIQNNSDIDLENAVLLIGNNAIPVGNLEAGGVIELGQKIAPSQAAGLVGSGGGMSTIRPAGGPGASPIATNYGVLLGTTSYFNNREVYPRWQLLQSISSEYRPSADAAPYVNATLVAWSDDEAFEVDLHGYEFRGESTTLYFLELPDLETRLLGETVELPHALLYWQVLDESGVYDASTSDFYLPQGWIEFEFTPWREFRSTEIEELEVVLLQNTTGLSQPPPQVYLWDWQDEQWQRLDNGSWGTIPVAGADNFVGDGNTIRIRLQNDSPNGIQIQEIYPRMSGRIAAH